MATYHRFRRLARLALLFGIMLWSLGTVPAQEVAKTLEWGEHANLNCQKSRAADAKINYQLELEEIRSNGQSVLVGEPFVGDVRELVFVVKNISDRPFAFIQVTVILPEVKIPPQVPFVRSVDSKAGPVRPGEQAELRVPPDKVYDWVKDTLTSQGMTLSTIKRAAIDGFNVEQGGRPVSVCATARDPRNEQPPK